MTLVVEIKNMLLKFLKYYRTLHLCDFENQSLMTFFSFLTKIDNLKKKKEKNENRVYVVKSDGVWLYLCINQKIWKSTEKGIRSVFPIKYVNFKRKFISGKFEGEYDVILISVH